jgi:hypothetical protein
LVAIGVCLTPACGGNSPAPSAPGPAPTPTPTTAPSIVQVYVGYGAQVTAVGISRQMYAYAKFSDGSQAEVTDRATWQSSNPIVATISPSGVLTTLQEGDVEVRAAFQGLEGAWVIMVRRSSRTGPPAPDEVIGKIHEIAPMEDVKVAYARVEISGGDQNGRSVVADSDGSFRIDGIHGAGFDLLISESGYRDGRYRIAQLPRDASSSIALEPQPWLVSETFGGSLCADTPPSAKSTKSTFFTPRGGGLFRMTSYRIALFEPDLIVLVANGVSTPVFFQTDYSLQPGVTYELRVSGTTDYPNCRVAGVYDGSFRVTYLRQR